MKTLHGYLTRQVLATLVMTVGIFTFILLLGNIVREVFTLLMSEQATAAIVLRAVALLIPYVLAFSIPMGLLAATLLTFGRFSADQELTAARAGGLSLLAMVSPVLLLAAAMSLLCAYINLELAPRCRQSYKDLIYYLGQQRPTSVLTEGRFVTDIPGYIIYVGRIQGDQLQDVLISVLNENNEVKFNLRAARGELVKHPQATNQFLLRLFNGVGASREKGGWQPVILGGQWEYPLKIPKLSERTRKLNELTFWQLRAELRRIEQLQLQAEGLSGLSPEQLRQRRAEMSKPPVDIASPLRVQMHQQAAFSFACLGFALIGIPLGVRGHRKETSIGVAIALFLVLVYYSFFILASALETKSSYYPHLLCWAPNFLFQIAGGWLLWRANRY